LDDVVLVLEEFYQSPPRLGEPYGVKTLAWGISHVIA
jgi:hypothetical protein